MFKNLFKRNNNKDKTVYVGLSGGVDSAVSAAILKDQGYNVIAVFIKTWAPDGYPCPSDDDKRQSMIVAAHLRIPWLEIDAEEAYKKNVAEYMLNEYKIGNTPNPDVFCNTTVKFGTFYDMAIGHGADFIATGHYAQMIKQENNTSDTNHSNFLMHTGLDNSKDQSYFLWNVPFEKLQKTIFPIGNLHKTKVRELAKEYKLPNANRPDSQGVCFLGPIDMKMFIKENLNPTTGNILNESGQIIGTHDGSILYTIGERHGFKINIPSQRPYFVINKNIENNTITVSHDVNDNTKENKNIFTKNENWLPVRPNENEIIDAVFRYHGEKIKVKLTNKNEILFVDKKINIAPGQSVVFYKDNICLGGGIVSY